MLNSGCLSCLLRNPHCTEIWKYKFPNGETPPILKPASAESCGKVAPIPSCWLLFSSGYYFGISTAINLGGLEFMSLTPNYSTACHSFRLYSVHDGSEV